jgi:hypothetical protein
MNTRRRHGLEHPEERFEFARVRLLNHYGRNNDFAAELARLASRHRETLDAVARQPVSRRIAGIAEYRGAWGILSFLSRGPGPGEAAHPLKAAIDSYRADLWDLCKKWGLYADWCAPSLHVALLAPRLFPGNFGDPDHARTLYPLFRWDFERQSHPPYDTAVILPRLLLQGDSPGQRVDLTLFAHKGERVYWDPRMDRWDDALAGVRRLLGKRRLSAALKKTLLERHELIEGQLVTEGYIARPKPRRLEGLHALARWTSWTYMAICPPRRTTDEILDYLQLCDRFPQVVDRGIAYVVHLLRLPRRPARPR